MCQSTCSRCCHGDYITTSGRISCRLVARCSGIFASGAISLGLSLALFYSAMRYIGAGRTGLISSTSTLWGVLGAILLLGEALTVRVIGAGLLMLIGVAIFAWEMDKEALRD